MTSAKTAAPSAALVTLLGRLRRRAIVVVALRHAVVATGAALGLAEVLLATGLVSDGTPTRWLAGAAVTAVTASAAAAVLLRPSLRAVARAADRRLGLDDHLVTALQCRDQDDAVARRVVADAVHRVTRLSSSVAFPLHLTAPTWLGALAMAVVPALVVAVLTARAARRADVAAAPSGGAPLVSAGAARPRGAATRLNTTAADTSAPGPASDHGTRAARDLVRTPSNEPDHADATAPTLALMPSSAPSSAKAAAPGGPPSGLRASHVATADASSAGAAPRVPNAIEPATGGRQGRARSADAAQRPSGPTQDTVARELVPPALREYVRRYLLAIQPLE